MNRHTAPWPDFGGAPIKEGDRMVLPSGDCGIVTLRPDVQEDTARWCIDYGHGSVRSLYEAVHTGRAVVLDESGMHF
jgi:hypothetical protein